MEPKGLLGWEFPSSSKQSLRDGFREVFSTIMQKYFLSGQLSGFSLARVCIGETPTRENNFSENYRVVYQVQATPKAIARLVTSTPAELLERLRQEAPLLFASAQAGLSPQVEKYTLRLKRLQPSLSRSAPCPFRRACHYANTKAGCRGNHSADRRAIVQRSPTGETTYVYRQKIPAHQRQQRCASFSCLFLADAARAAVSEVSPVTGAASVRVEDQGQVLEFSPGSPTEQFIVRTPLLPYDERQVSRHISVHDLLGQELVGHGGVENFWDTLEGFCAGRTVGRIEFHCGNFFVSDASQVHGKCTIYPSEPFPAEELAWFLDAVTEFMRDNLEPAA